REIMQKKLVATPALAGLVALPVAGYVTWQMLDEFRLNTGPGTATVETEAPARQRVESTAARDAEVAGRHADALFEAAPPPARTLTRPLPTVSLPRAIGPSAAPATRDMAVGGQAASKT